MKRFLRCALSVLLLILICGYRPAFACGESASCCAAQAVTTSESTSDVTDALDILGVGAKTSKPVCQVYLGGQCIGLTIDGEGVTVIGLNEFVGENGKLCCPAVASGLQINDVIIALDGKKIYNSAKLSQIAVSSNGRSLSVDYLRDGEACKTTITPQKDFAEGAYRLGLWTRDSSGGIGTLTYVKKDLSFGSLGHPVCDANGNIVECSKGGVFSCVPDGVLKGKRGAAGELRGKIDFDMRLGCLSTNCQYGMYGQFSALPSFCSRLIDVAQPDDVVPGNAEIYCTLPDAETQSYKVEIVKASYQKSCREKGLVVRITDERLLNVTGGIVQGMSGSPIVQNGKLVGAVTHVFVNDPTRGYGIYAKWMVEQR